MRPTMPAAHSVTTNPAAAVRSIAATALLVRRAAVVKSRDV